MNQSFEIAIERFDGPLDLLLDLVRRGGYPIEDLPLAEITAQYLEYVQRAGDLDIELGGDFIETAATLIQAKARALLPRDPVLVEREPDLRADLVRQLLTHDQMRQAAALLAARQADFGDPNRLEPNEDSQPALESSSHSLLDLLHKIRALRRSDWTRPLPVTPDEAGASLAELIEWMERRQPGAPSLLFSDLAGDGEIAGERCGLFLAILEVARRGQVSLSQTRPFGPIRVIRPRPTTLPAGSAPAATTD